MLLVFVVLTERILNENKTAANKAADCVSSSKRAVVESLKLSMLTNTVYDFQIRLHDICYLL